MQPVSYARHRFPPEVIRHAIWLYLRFTLSHRDVEELLAERRLDVSYEIIRRWVVKFGPAVARNLSGAMYSIFSQSLSSVGMAQSAEGTRPGLGTIWSCENMASFLQV